MTKLCSNAYSWQEMVLLPQPNRNHYNETYDSCDIKVCWCLQNALISISNWNEVQKRTEISYNLRKHVDWTNVFTSRVVKHVRGASTGRNAWERVPESSYLNEKMSWAWKRSVFVCSVQIRCFQGARTCAAAINQLPALIQWCMVMNFSARSV